MTYQKPSLNYDPTEESSSFRNVGAVSFSSAVFGQAEADEELVVPTKHPRSSTPSWKTKKLLMCAGIMGMTAAVASSVMVLFTILDVSNQESTEPSFLLNDRGGADDDTCLPASGPWPTGRASRQGNAPHPYVTCFVSTTGGYCWSHSFYNGDYWEPCTPNGFYQNMWNVHSPHDNDFYDDVSGDLPVETCGTPCTEFTKKCLSC